MKKRKYRASKYKFPTRIIQGSSKGGGGISLGHVKAKEHLQTQTGKKLQLHKSGKFEWIFIEAVSEES